MTQRTRSRGPVAMRLGVTVLLVLVVVLPRAPSNAIQKCPATNPGARDTSRASVAFAAKLSSPYTFKFDTGFKPSGFPMKLRQYLYASAGEFDVKAAGDMVATWEKTQACPGGTLQVDIGAQADAGQSRWISDGGLRFGTKYQIDVDKKGIDFFLEDYVPNVPNFDVSWPCNVTLNSFYLDQPLSTCPSFTWGANANCAVTFTDPFCGNCTPPQACTHSGGAVSFGFDWCFSPPPDEVPADSSREFCLKFYPHPTVELQLCGELGFCTTFSLDGHSIVDTLSGDSIATNNGLLNIAVPIPCDFAQQSSEQRIFRFTREFAYRGDILFNLVGKLAPVIKPCFAEFLEASLTIGAAICGLVVPNSLLSISYPLPFTRSPATFEVPIIDPEVCLVRPSSGSAMAGSVVPVTWLTTWGAPDNCNCRVKVEYQTRVPGGPWPPTWAPISMLPDTLNIGSLDWAVPPLPCTEARIRVEFRDPTHNFLHALVGTPFQIAPPLPALSLVEPLSIDFGPVPGFADRTFTITNNDTTYDLSGNVDIVPPGPHFSIVSGGGPYSLNPGQSRQVVVRYEPHSPGSHQATVVTGACDVTVMGTAAAAIPLLNVWGVVVLLALLTAAGAVYSAWRKPHAPA